MSRLAQWCQRIGAVSRKSARRGARRAATGSAAAHPRTLGIEELEGRRLLTLLGAQLFPADNPWNQNISAAPVAANSAAIISRIGTGVHVHADWGEDSPANGSAPLYGIPVNVVHGNTAPKINFTIDNYPDESDIVSVPMPASPVIEGDYQNGPNMNGGGYKSNQRGDSHLIIWDMDNNVAYELYGASRPNDPTLFPDDNGIEATKTDSLWHAAQETVWDMKTNTFRTLGYTSADAAGLSILAGLVRPDEGLTIAQGGQGAINHALRFTLHSGDINPQYIYPASHMVTVGSQSSTKLPMGARLRLANTPAVNNLIANMPPQSQIIARAMQQYGLILADVGSAMYVTGSSATVNANNQINLVWDPDDIFASNGLQVLTAANFEVVDLTPRVSSLSASSAAAGTTITINGQNFSGAAGHLSVMFGSTPSTSVTYVSDQQLRAVVPAGSGTVYVTVRSGVPGVDPDNPAHNVTNPVFGYGTSPAVTAGQFTFTTALVGDANHDGIVNGQDIALVASNWLTHGPTGDVNFDNIVNGQDIALIASNWLATAGTSPGAANTSLIMPVTSTAKTSPADQPSPWRTSTGGASSDLVAATNITPNRERHAMLIIAGEVAPATRLLDLAAAKNLATARAALSRQGIRLAEWHRETDSGVDLPLPVDPRDR